MGCGPSKDEGVATLAIPQPKYYTPESVAQDKPAQNPNTQNTQPASAPAPTRWRSPQPAQEEDSPRGRTTTTTTRTRTYKPSSMTSRPQTSSAHTRPPQPPPHDTSASPYRPPSLFYQPSTSYPAQSHPAPSHVPSYHAPPHAQPHPTPPHVQPQDTDDIVSVAPSLASEFRTVKDVNFDSQYHTGNELGSGAFAMVFLGTHHATAQQYAVKKVDRSKMTWGGRDNLIGEINNLKLVRNGPNIVQLYEVYEENVYCYLVMELMQGGELFERIIEKRTFSEKEARDVLKCLMDGLHYMHKHRVVHRDLKPENLLLKSYKLDTEVKLADFGFAKRLNYQNEGRTLCGTPGYLAPEMLERFPAYDTKCDTWSAGVILFLLLGGYLPFHSDEEDELFDLTRNGQYSFHPDYFKGVSSSGKNLVTQLLTVNPKKRASTEEALNHTWMDRDETELKHKLNVNKLKRSVVRDRAKNKAKDAGHQGAGGDDRLGLLNKQYESYLSKRTDSMTVFTKPSIVPQSRPVVEDSATGQPFLHFYSIGSVLGKGCFATVKRAVHRESQNVVAVKDVDFSRLQERARDALKDEVAALKLLRGGPHIVRLIDVFEESMHTYIIMEEMKGGELLKRIVNKEVYTEREARDLCRILFSAVDYMHKKKIAHRDLKPDNLLLSEKNDDTSIKVADFGFAKKVVKPFSLKTLCGTASYVAPEVLDLKWKGYDTKADMWSVGVIVYILLGGYAPFEGDVHQLAQVIMRGQYEFHDEYWSHISPGAKDLVHWLLQVNPKRRISAEEALISEWMVVESESLISIDLATAQSQIRRALPIDKVRGAVNAIIAANKLTAAGVAFTKNLGSSTELKSRQSIMPAPPRPREENGRVVEDSSSGKAFADLFEPEVQIGQGAFSIMLQAKQKQSGIRYAVKRIDRRNLHPDDAVSVQDEIDALRSVAGCPQIVRLYDIFDESDWTYLILEKTKGGELIDRITKRTSYTEYDAKEICEVLLQGVNHCHMRKIAIRNLKLENLVLVREDSDTDAKICDFSYAKKVLYPNSLRTQCGTEGYVAPEILEHRPEYDVQCDLWSLGVVIYILLGGYRPFRGTSKEVMRQIRYGEFYFHDEYWRHVSHNAKDMIRRMLTVNPQDRISAQHALSSAWIKADDDELSHIDLRPNQDILRRGI